MNSGKSIEFELNESTWLEFIITNKIEICLFAYSCYCLWQFLWVIMFEAPQFRSIFESMNITLPVITEGVLALSYIMNDWWFIFFPAVFGFIVNFGLFFTLWCRVKEIRIESSVKKIVPFLVLVTSVFVLSMLSKMVQWAMFTPMLKLVNSVG